MQPAPIEKNASTQERSRGKKRLIILLGIVLASAILTVWLINGPQVKKNVVRSLAVFNSYNFFQRSVDVSTQSQVSPIDGMRIVFIPAGNFIMGSNAKEFQKSRPERKVYLEDYWIDQTEVTNAMYARCVADQACEPPIHSAQTNQAYLDPAHAADPVVYVTWNDALAYCIWTGRRLPTEAEWEKAARGTDGRTYPWGNALPTTRLLNYDDNIGSPMPVDRYPLGASPYGVLNMAGNVREWVADWYSAAYYRHAPSYNPTGPAAGEQRALRGGSYLDGWREVRIVNRFFHDPASPGVNRGFRCAVSEPTAIP